MKLKRSGHWLLEINRIFTAMNTNPVEGSNKFFSYFIYKNLNNFKLEIENFKPIMESLQASDEYKEYEQKKAELLETYAEKDSYGRFKTQSNPRTGEAEFLINKNSYEAFKEKDLALLEEYKDAIKTFEVQVNETDQIFKEELEIEVFKISFKKLPENIDISKFRDLILETDEEIEAMIMNSNTEES